MDATKIRHLFIYHRPSPDAVDSMRGSREILMALAIKLTDEYGESGDLTVAIRSLHRASMEINYAIIVADEKRRDAIQQEEVPT